jgi:hypothetical protein
MLMQIHVHFLGDMARRAGTARRAVEVPNPAMVADAVQALASDEALAGELSRCTFSVGGVIVGASYQLLAGADLLIEAP